MSDHSDSRNSPSFLEVELDPNSWKTEFYEEIKAVRLNGEKIAEIRDLMDEMKSIKETTDRKVQILVFAIFILTFLSLGVILMGVRQMNKLKADKINEVVDAGISRFDMTDQTFMPVEAFKQLSEFNQLIYWDENTEKWFIERPQKGSKQRISDLILFSHHAYNRLPEIGFQLKQSRWQPTSEVPPLSDD